MLCWYRRENDSHNSLTSLGWTNNFSIMNLLWFIVGLFEDDKIIYSFLLACSLGKESKGLMDSEEWKYLLNCTQGPDEEKDDGGNGNTDEETTAIGINSPSSTSWTLFIFKLNSFVSFVF